ncbi:hypothetical protein LSTR_LSTR012509, partial [Laodelphax striatellus]
MEWYGCLSIVLGSDCAIVKHLKKLSKLASNKATNLALKIKIFNMETHIEKRLNHKWKCIALTPKSSDKESSSTSKNCNEPKSATSIADVESEESKFNRIYEKAFEGFKHVQKILVEKASTLIKLRQHSEQYEDVALILESISQIFPDTSNLNYLINADQLEELGKFLSKLLKTPAASIYHGAARFWPSYLNIINKVFYTFPAVATFPKFGEYNSM